MSRVARRRIKGELDVWNSSSACDTTASEVGCQKLTTARSEEPDILLCRCPGAFIDLELHRSCNRSICVERYESKTDRRIPPEFSQEWRIGVYPLDVRVTCDFIRGRKKWLQGQACDEELDDYNSSLEIQGSIAILEVIYCRRNMFFCPSFLDHFGGFQNRWYEWVPP